ncbi:MAG TPA: hypothetical protein VGS19_28975 [Streptosporangiaceae bacterium]|nr:hypothetical protein [Streptosporangiaceae bacterium]
MAKSAYRECECHTRILIVRGFPPLNYGKDPAGPVAVTITDPRQGRWLAKGEDAGPLEHRYSPHECGHAQPARRPAPTQPTLDTRTTP